MVKIILTLSVIANIYMAWLISQRQEPEPSYAPSDQEHTSILNSVRANSSAPWDSVESSSPSKLATNLRAIGCPENLIRNAVAAEINRSYQKRAEALRHIPQFWSTHDTREAEEGAYGLAFWELDEARRAELVRETGSEITPEKHWKGMKKAMVGAALFGFLEPGKLEETAALFEHASQSGRLLNKAAKGMTPEYALEQRQALYAEYEQQMGRLLTQSERYQAELVYYEIDLFDVWSDEQQFGRKLDRDEKHQLLKILMPPDFISNRLFSLPMASTNDVAYQEQTISRLRETFGDALVDHYLSFKQR